MKHVNQIVNGLFDKAKLGDTKSQFLLAEELSKDKNNVASMEKAFRLFKQFACAGNPDAQYILGQFYEGEYGICYLDYQEAFNWYKEAKLNNHSEAIKKVKDFEGNEKQQAEKVALANKGDNNAMYWLAYRCYSKGKYREAQAWLKKACSDEIRSHGVLRLQAYMFSEELGLSGEINSYGGNALDFYQKAAEKGNPEAQFILGEYWSGWNSMGFYRISEGDEEYETAFYYYRMAANNGHKDAQLRLSLLYHNGLGGIGQNYVEAFSWMYKAAYASTEFLRYDAPCYLAEYYTKDWVFTKPNYPEAMIWYTISERLFDRDEERSKLINAVNAKLNPQERVYADQEANRRLNVLTEQGSLGPYSDNELDAIIDIILSANNVSNSNIPDESDIDRMELTDTVEFKHINDVKKAFDPDKIKIKLVVGEAKKEDETPDFKYLVFSYGKHYDKKSIDLFSRSEYKLHQRERNLLMKLAIQNEDNDLEKRSRSIASILKNPGLDQTILSCFNRLIVGVFPGCFRYKQSNWVDRNTGTLKIPVNFHDVWNIQSCKEYSNLSKVVLI